MEDVIALIDKIIEEHKTLFQDFQNLEQLANDAKAIVGLDKAKEKFMPGRFENKQGLEELEKLLKRIEQGIQAHFKREEGALLNAFEKHGGKRLSSALHLLLVEHKTLSDRLDYSKQDVGKLKSGSLSRGVWEPTGYDMRAHINQTRRLFEVHAEMEQELLHTLRSELSGISHRND